MTTVGKFEDEVTSLKKAYCHGCYEYSDLSKTFTQCTTLHFKKVKQQEKYGVYIVRRKYVQEVLYIGIGGRIDSKGKFKGDIPGRLKAGRGKEGKIKADEWFRNLHEEKGDLIIEYIFLPKSKSPALVEATLLQAYLNEHLNEHRCLPYKNEEL